MVCCCASRDSFESSAKPCSSVLGTMLLAICCSHIAFFRPRTVVTPRSHRGRAPFAPIRGNTYKSLAARRRTPALALATIAGLRGDRRHQTHDGCCRTVTLKYDTKMRSSRTSRKIGSIVRACGDYALTTREYARIVLSTRRDCAGISRCLLGAYSGECTELVLESRTTPANPAGWMPYASIRWLQPAHHAYGRATDCRPRD